MLLYEDHESILSAIAFSPDGSLLASGTRDGSLILRDSFDTATPLWPPESKPAGIVNLAFLAADRLLAVHDSGWDVLREADGIWPLSTRGEQPGLVAAAPLSDSLLAVGTGKRMTISAGMFQLHDLKSGRAVQPTFRESGGVRAVATDPAHKIVAWSTADKWVKVWDVKKQTPTPFRMSHVASSLAVSPDGSAVAVVQDWAVRIIDLGTKLDRVVLKGHKGVVSCVAFSPDGATLATGSWDGTVRFWDSRSGQERAVFQWPIGKVFTLAFAPDGQRVAAGGDRGAVVVWDVD
jgi:WD40 repeat protein